MVCHIDKDNPGHLYVQIPVCVRCKRAMKRETVESDLTTVNAPTVTREIRFKCPKGHAVFLVGKLDLAEMTKYPPDKIHFESSTSLDPSQFPILNK